MQINIALVASLYNWNTNALKFWWHLIGIVNTIRHEEYFRKTLNLLGKPRRKAIKLDSAVNI